MNEMNGRAGDMPEQLDRRYCTLPECGEEIVPSEHDRIRPHAAITRKFCSKACASAYARTVRQERIAVDPDEAKICAREECGQEFRRRPSVSRSNFRRTRFCSRSCAGKAKATNLEGGRQGGASRRGKRLVEIPEKDCAECGQRMEIGETEKVFAFRKRRYCRDLCRNIARQRNLRRNQDPSHRNQRPVARRTIKPKISKTSENGDGKVFPDSKNDGVIWRPAAWPREVNPWAGKRAS